MPCFLIPHPQQPPLCSSQRQPAVCLCAHKGKTRRGNQFRTSECHRRKCNCFLYYSKYYPVDRRMLPGFDLSVIYLYPAVRTGGTGAGRESDPPGRCDDRQPGNRTFHTSGRCKPLCGLRCGKCKSEADIKSSCITDHSGIDRTAVSNLYT